MQDAAVVPQDGIADAPFVAVLVIGPAGRAGQCLDEVIGLLAVPAGDADGDLVATRWHASFKPETFIGKIYGMEELAIINVFRIKDGKIVEIWNHRHDIETNQTMKFTFRGLIIGLLIALIPTIIAIRLRRKQKKIKA